MRFLPLLAFIPSFLSAQESNVLEEIVVTALKREQLLQDVPASVSVLNAGRIQDAGIQSISDVTHQIPTLEMQASTSPITTNLRIRRVGNFGNIPTFEPAVGLFIDGAYRSRSAFAASDLFGIDRMEVLRSPQTSLYGKNTSGGVVAIFTLKPEHEFHVNAELGVGIIDGAINAHSRQAKVYINSSLTDDVAASIDLSYTNSGPVFRQAFRTLDWPINDNNRHSVRASLLWEPDDATEWRLIASSTEENSNREAADLTYDPEGYLVNTILPVWRAAGISDTCYDNDPHNRKTCVIRPNTSDMSVRELTLLYSHVLPNGWSVDSISSWDSLRFRSELNDVAQMQAPLLRFLDSQDGESWQQELRLSSPGGEALDWMTGAFLYRNNNERGDGGKHPVYVGDMYSAHPLVSQINRQVFNFPIPLPMIATGQQGFLDSFQDTGYYAVYGQVTWNPATTLSLVGGLRWQHESKTAAIRQWASSPEPSVVSVVLSPASVSAENLTRDSERLTWSLTPQWRLTDDVMVFATIASGFKSGGFNTSFGNLPIANREIADELVRHSEAGIKWNVSNQLRLAANVFHTTFDNYQDSAFANGQFRVGNAEAVQLEGMEIEGNWNTGKNLTIDFAVSFADLVYRKNLSGLCPVGKVPDSPLNNGSCDLSGRHPVNAPEWKTHLGLQYVKSLSSGDLVLRVDWSWSDEYHANFSGDSRLNQDAYHWIDLNVGLHRNNQDFLLWAKNAGNATVANYNAEVIFYAGDLSYQSYLQAPRSFGVSYRLRY